ncbi:MAG: hypothetical protein A3E78_14045 [Alphaproteobacteria bacterium RIFCSPHIGHO2_12_FULL_63_12]|nr:MAG: hypothetical protein A3E78_14045 [Alphaproteobacteria bacterium RIFCSPHIGHO2_12_FULL_63_12]
MPVRCALIAIIFGVLISPAAANAPVSSPLPSWVEPVVAPPADESDAAKAENGVYYLLFDTQVRIEKDFYTHYSRIVRKVTDRAGLEEAGRLDFEFDPTEDEFSIHTVRVFRDGVTVAEIDASAFKVIQRETELDDGITDGDLTAVAELPDIRVGDIIDYEVSWLFRSQIWPGEFFSNFSTQWSVPLGRLHWKALTSIEKPLTVRRRGDAPALEARNTAEGLVYELSLDKPEIVRGEDAVPETFATWGEISVSTLKDWRSVVETLMPVYDPQARLSPELAARIVPSAGSPEDRITRAVRYVQDEIRYVADESGVGSHRPRDPATVVMRGWGDCKDKALLLVAILREMGVQSDVALTDNDEGRALPQMAPSPFSFDHAIAIIFHNGEHYWIDATNTHQGGVFPAIAAPAYGFGLPVRKDVTDLWPIETKSADSPEFKISEGFDFAARNTDGISLAVKSEFHGRRADGIRQTLATESRDSLSKKYLDYYGGLYDGIVPVADLAVSDDRDKNIIIIDEKYRLPSSAFTDELKSEFPIQADAIRNAVASFTLAARRAPISLPYPFHAQHIVSLKNTGVTMSKIDGSSVKKPEFEFSRVAMPERDSIWISWTLKTLASEIPVGRIDDYRALTKEMDDWNIVSYNLDGSSAADLSPLEIASIVALAAAILTAAFALFAGITARADDLATIDRSVLYPVGTRKFLILGAATLGLYFFFWMYRCWRNIRGEEEREINPLFRAFFGVFFFYPLFDEIRRRLPEGARPATALGAVLAASFLVLSITGSAASRIANDPGWGQAAIGLSDAVIFLLALPLVIWVNRLNRDNPDVIAEHSRWKTRTFALLAFGLSLWLLVIVGAFTPAEPA